MGLPCLVTLTWAKLQSRVFYIRRLAHHTMPHQKCGKISLMIASRIFGVSAVFSMRFWHCIHPLERKTWTDSSKRWRWVSLMSHPSTSQANWEIWSPAWSGSTRRIDPRVNSFCGCQKCSSKWNSSSWSSRERTWGRSEDRVYFRLLRCPKIWRILKIDSLNPTTKLCPMNDPLQPNLKLLKKQNPPSLVMI